MIKSWLERWQKNGGMVDAGTNCERAATIGRDWKKEMGRKENSKKWRGKIRWNDG
jgi:hypothetical protein